MYRTRVGSKIKSARGPWGSAGPHGGPMGARPPARASGQISSGQMGSTLMGSLQTYYLLTEGTFGYSRQVYVPLRFCRSTNKFPRDLEGCKHPTAHRQTKGTAYRLELAAAAATVPTNIYKGHGVYKMMRCTVYVTAVAAYVCTRKIHH